MRLSALTFCYFFVKKKVKVNSIKASNFNEVPIKNCKPKLMNLNTIYEWIDQEMKFDTWYPVKTEEQKQSIIQILQSGLFPDCEFNNDYTQFRKSKEAYEHFIKP
jgi:hypothetical protein